jgi:hypothetical protein
MIDACVACGGDSLVPLLEVGTVPAVVGALWPTAERATNAATGEMRLAVCHDCSHVSNTAFDPSLVEYDASYENSLHFSSSFQRYADALAERLIARYDVRGKTVLEIGSGKGEFLKSLCEKGRNTGRGYDPTYHGESDSPDVTFIRDLYPLDGTGEPFDFLVCQHVLEHLADPYELLCGLRKGCANADVRVYLEVPNGSFTMSPSGQWDLIHPHVSYFTTASLRHLVERSGFAVLDEGTSFDGQFLYVEAAPADAASNYEEAAEQAEVAALVSHAESFAVTYQSTVEAWRRRLAPDAAAGTRVAALWGAGAKGTTFANAVGRDSRLAVVVDVNPRKWGLFLPGTGQVVFAPAALRDVEVDTVVITNAAYLQEIRDELATLGIGADVVCV